MDAKQAREQALLNKTQMEENAKQRKADSFSNDVTSLHEHAKSVIETAVAKGLTNTKTLDFDKARFSLDVFREVASKLKLDGYNVNFKEHTAFQKMCMEISWV